MPRCGQRHLRRFMDFRTDNDDNRFFDVSFLAMQQDPIGAVGHLYGELGDDFSVDTRHRMQDWWEASAADRKSIPQQPERFGLDMAAMRQQFAFYHDRFVTTPTTTPERQRDR